MAMRSGSSKASLMLANETRSGLRDREGDGQLLRGGIAAGGCGTALLDGWANYGPDQGLWAARARVIAAELRGQPTQGRTATLHLNHGRALTQPLGRRT